MLEITTPRLRLMPVTLVDAATVAQLVTEKISAWTSPIPWPYTLRDAEQWIGSTAPCERMGIYREDELMGMVSMPSVNGDEAGFWINERYEGRGYVSEAMTAVIDYVFTHTAVRVIDSSVHRDNFASRRIHEKLGYRLLKETECYWPNKKAMIPVALYRLTA